MHPISAAHPEYLLEVHVYGCAFDIRMNDVPVFANSDGFGGAVELPLNPWICPGRNQLAWTLRPHASERVLSSETRCETIVIARPMGAITTGRKQLAQLTFDRDEFHGQAPTVAARDVGVELEAPFPPPIWFGAPPIGDRDAAFNTLWPMLQRIHSLLGRRQLDALMDLSSMKNQQLAAALYVTEAQRTADFRREIETCYRDGDMELESLDQAKVRLNIFGHGRLCNVTRNDGRSALRFRQRNSTVTAAIPAYFCRLGHSWGWVR